ncbi:class I SAM-dependent methyltransferase [Bacillus daqingensis]|uniref:Class I SAM-dependent methyltransferase n=1 Tax=Bacillus daqingensis TaxID=872396 RepID=A0ABV9NPE8_9BACI
MHKPLYDQIGRSYDMTRRADPRIAKRIRELLDVRDSARVMDAACGTGNYTQALANTGLQMTGVDVSGTMLDQAKEKFPELTWEQADLSSMPFRSAQFDGAVCVLSIHHLPDLNAAFRTVHRVMKEGRFVIFTSSPEQMQTYWLYDYFPEMMKRSAEQMQSVEEVKSALVEAGFADVKQEPYFIDDDLEDFFLYSGKHEPEMYLDPTVRSGISSFASLADEAEVKSGVEKLQGDIASGEIENVMKRYASEAGDYVYITAVT